MSVLTNASQIGIELFKKFKTVMGKTRATEKNVAVDFAAGVAAASDSSACQSFWDSWWAEYANCAYQVFDGVDEGRMVAAGMSEVMRLRVQNAVLSHRLGQANAYLYEKADPLPRLGKSAILPP